MTTLQKTFRYCLLFLLSLSITPILSAQCAFNNFEWTQEECAGGAFYITFSFDNPQPSEDGFIVWRENGATYFIGSYLYGESSYSIGPFASDGTHYEFSLYNYNTNDCEHTFSVGTVECPPSDDCSLFASAQQSDCFGGGNFQWMFFVYPTNPGSQGFTIYNEADEVVLVSEDYSQYDYMVEGTSTGESAFSTFYVSDNETSCTQEVVAYDQGCSVCQIELGSAELTSCNDAGEYFVDFTVQSSGSSSGQFYVRAAYNYGVEWGPFDYGQDLYTVGPITTLGPENFIEVYDADPGAAEDACITGAYFGQIDCQTLLPCELSISNFEIGDCAAGLFEFNFQLFTQNVGSQNFLLFVDGTPFTALPYGLESYSVFLPATGQTLQVFVQDGENGIDCGAEISIDAPICSSSDCEFANLNADYQGCDEELGTAYMLDFIPPADATNTFTLSIGDVVLAVYAYVDLPVIINVPAQPGNYGTLTLCDSVNSDCCVSFEVDTQNCDENPVECTAEITFVENNPCDEAGQFTVTFGVAGIAEGQEFSVFGNGDLLGIFAAGEASYTVGYFDGDGEDDELIITDLSQEGCMNTAVVEGQNCLDNFPCGFENVAYEFLECNEEGNPVISLDFEPVNTTNDFFDITTASQVLSFAYADLPIEFVVPINDNLISTFIISDNDNADCAQEYAVEYPDCNDNQDCNFEISDYEIICYDNWEFYVNLSLTGLEEGQEFTLIANDETTEGLIFSEEELYLTGPFNQIDAQIWEFEVISNADENCTDNLTITSVDCDTEPECYLEGAEFVASECDGDSFFFNIYLDESSYGSTLNIYVNGQSFGPFEYGAEQYQVGPFVGDNTTEYEIEIYDNEHDQCFVTLFSEPIFCGVSDCFIDNLEVSTTECDEENTYDVLLNFDYNDEGEEAFTVQTEGEILGTYAIADLPILIENFPSEGLEASVTICLEQQEDCCLTEDFLTPGCNLNQCGIGISSLEFTECNEQGEFFVNFSLVQENVTNQFNVSINGEDYGNFVYGEESYNVGPIDAENSEMFDLLIADLVFEECVVGLSIEGPSCVGFNVWPGDANNNGVADNEDILNIGIAFNAVGPQRAAEDQQTWQAQFSQGFAGVFSNNLNYAFADTDGNGQIDYQDVGVVDVNYGLVHGDVLAYTPPTPTPTSPALYADMPDSFEITQGASVHIPIIFGTDNLPVSDAYGLAFTLNYDPEIFDPESVLVQYPISWMGFPATNLITYSKHFVEEGKIDVAITRIDQNNVSGWGEIMHFIGIIDNIAGKEEVFIEITDVKALTLNETPIAVNTPMEITAITVSTDELNKLEGFELFPNPTTDVLYVKNETAKALISMTLRDLTGRPIIFAKEESSLNLAKLSAGVYILEADFGEVTVRRRIVKL